MLTMRVFKTYIRSPGNVFFSLLTMCIVIVLMLLFLGDMNIDNAVELAEQFGGSGDGLRENAENMLFFWTLGGILSVNLISVPLAVNATLVSDKESGRMKAFACSPVSRLRLGAAYIAASVLAATMISVIAVAVSEVYILMKGGSIPTAAQHFELLAAIIVNAFCYSALMMFLALMVKSSGAWGGMGTVVGTLIGFLGAIYIPVAGLSEGIANALKFTPVLHGAALFRNILTERATADFFSGMPAEVLSEYRLAMGITVEIGEHTLSLTEQGMIIGAVGIIMLAAAAVVMKKRGLCS